LQCSDPQIQKARPESDAMRCDDEREQGKGGQLTIDAGRDKRWLGDADGLLSQNLALQR
jgi:hypothetical protein